MQEEVLSHGGRSDDLYRGSLGFSMQVGNTQHIVSWLLPSLTHHDTWSCSTEPPCDASYRSVAHIPNFLTVIIIPNR